MQVRAFERYIPLKKLTYQNLKTEAALLFLLMQKVIGIYSKCVVTLAGMQNNCH